MKVLFVSIYDPLKVSGPGNHLRHLSEALSALGCEVHVLTGGSITKSIKSSGVYVHYFKPRFFGSMAYGFMFSLLSIGMINQIVEKYGIDIIHGHSPSTFGYAGLPAKKTPLVVTVHSTSFGELISFTNAPIKQTNSRIIRDAFLIQPLTALLTLVEYKFADKIIAVSADISREVRGFYRIRKEKIAVIHNGVNPPVFKSSQQSKAYTIMFVGRLVWRKGLKYVIDALPAILKKYSNTKLIVIGKGEQEIPLKKLLNQNKIEQSVEFQGFVSEEKLLSQYRSADIYIQPSLYEPCPLALLDAMSFGKPIVASNIGGIPELITTEHDGILVAPASSSEIVEAVNRLFAEATLKDTLGHNAADTVKKDFTWEKMAQKTLRCYESLL